MNKINQFVTFIVTSLMIIMLSTTSLRAGNGPNDPVIKTNKSTYNVGDEVTVTVSNIKNNGNIVVHYCLLDGRYSATNPNKKWQMNKRSNTTHYFGPMSDAWANKWLKIIAENTTTGTWSNELYFPINSGTITLDILTPADKREYDLGQKPQIICTAKTTNASKLQIYIKHEKTGNYWTVYDGVPTEKEIIFYTNRLSDLGQYILSYQALDSKGQIAQKKQINITMLDLSTGKTMTTFTTKDYTKIGNPALRNFAGYNYYGDINASNGLRFTLNRNFANTATFNIRYKTDPDRGCKIIVNGSSQNVIFSKTGWSSWGIKTVQVSLRQGTNIIEFRGGYSTEWAPDIAEITVK